jgi:hypothetical protein
MGADRLRVTAESEAVFLIEGGPTVAGFDVTNVGRNTVVVRPWLSVPRGFHATVEPDVLRLRPGQSRRVTAEIAVTDRRMPRGTLTLHAGDAFAWVSMIASDDWVRVATMSASSEHPDGFRAEWLKDGWTFDAYRWNENHGWVDGTPGEFPDWVVAEWSEAVELSLVRVVTRDGPSAPAETHGVRDYDVQVRDGDAWRTVAEVRGNVAGTIDSDFPAVSTTALRIYVLASNDGEQSRLVEIEAYGPGGSPRSRVLEMYGGPGGPFPE